MIKLIVGHKYNFKTDGFISIQTSKGEIYNTIFTETYEIEDDDEYETVADAFVDRLEDFFEIDNQ